MATGNQIEDLVENTIGEWGMGSLSIRGGAVLSLQRAAFAIGTCLALQGRSDRSAVVKEHLLWLQRSIVRAQGT
jgi:hypothetical protein